MDEIIEEVKTYKWILVLKDTKEYVVNYHNSENEPYNAEPDKLEWIEWGKELPEMFDLETGEEIAYIYDKGELVKA